MTEYKEWDHIRDRITHEDFQIANIYADGLIVARRVDGSVEEFDPRDIELDPFYYR